MKGENLPAIGRIMARQWRIEYPGAFYQILSRGNERQEIFRSDDDREMFLNLIGEFSDRFQIDVGIDHRFGQSRFVIPECFYRESSYVLFRTQIPAKSMPE